jgi:hypothetical protein
VIYSKTEQALPNFLLKKGGRAQEKRLFRAGEQSSGSKHVDA